MLRSLWSGVSGMQAHQVALDVESNNIANVNTNGFKYSRADFSTMVSQTKRAATIPYAGYGGVNDYSVGLGTGIETTTKIFSQGSLQNTDRKADLALEGNGMFVVSNNGGFTNMYTRDGAFSFDAVGNLVTTSGYIVQGWVRDLSKLNCDCGSGNINRVDSTGPIGNITIDPRLTIPAKATETVTGNINLTSGTKTENTTCPSPLDSTSANNYIAGGLDRLYDTADRQLEVAQDMGVMFNDAGEAMQLQEGQGIWVSYQTATTTPLHINAAAVGASSITINGVTITWNNDPTATGSSNLLAAQVAINNLKDTTGVEALTRGDTLILQNTNQLDGDGSNKNIRVTAMNGALEGFETQAGGAAGPFVQTTTVTTAFKYNYTLQTDADSTSGQFRTTEDLRALMQQDANKVKEFGGDSAAAAAGMTGPNPTFLQSNYTVSVKLNSNGQFEINNRDDGVNVANNQQGAAYDNLNIFVSAYNDTLTTTNVLFKNQMKAMNTGVLVEGGNITSTAGLRMATYSQTLDIYDSLGNKHDFTIQFTKVAGNQWNWRIIVPEPAELIGGTAQRPNILEGGSVTFGEQGEILGFNPSTIQFKPNNGAAFPQSIDLDFGTSGGYDGLTSTAAESQANNIDGDGYTAGMLQDFYFDATGTMIGKFDNGQTLALAQVAVASFANYEGLQESGSNLFAESPNSGGPTIGTAGSGGRASIQASKLEMSNSDLSRGLTQLIVVQRGFQASSKSITTSDQILNTLLGLKQ
ncbi:flagellar hook protein FlgE [Helicobacter canadensis]|uniref:Flagellar hook protein FlgE n=1 Tax=Helicobacter canadensis MIT 98-5491 TaxID=537970 RepID=C5ZVV6_9HELI|nr:flagellar hook protein FlgE [Helicobacter canadensis]EES89037.1 flagellar hook protein [Helicobacter canadensis MIT 98-5491]EFR49407.1 flagellar hook protein FlgE [Helicobacter canadensis MIT 98-5491]STO99066.1 flagellar hook protein FlgE [Helicobacter canadensis]